jgi:hypothetical protein
MQFNYLRRPSFLLFIILRVMGGFLYPAGAGLFVPLITPLFTFRQL